MNTIKKNDLNDRKDLSMEKKHIFGVGVLLTCLVGLFYLLGTGLLLDPNQKPQVRALNGHEAADHQVGAHEQRQAERDLSDRQRLLDAMRGAGERHPARAFVERGARP